MRCPEEDGPSHGRREVRLGSQHSNAVEYHSLFGDKQSTDSWPCPLQSIIFKLHDRRTVGGNFLEELITGHGDTLKSLSSLNCDMYPDTLRRIAEFCPRLEKPAVNIPSKDSVSN